MGERVFDVAVIGGGINGAGIALDAALRGLSVLLVEKDDFGAHTSSANTHLIHGGLRYLEHLDFALVRESLRERERLLANAPHLVRPLEIQIPIYRHGRRGRLKIKAGMLLYDLLSWGKSMPRHGFRFRLGGEHPPVPEPCIAPEGLKGLASYHDAQVAYPARLCLELALDARESGAVLRNHCELLACEPGEEGLSELMLLDRLEDRRVRERARVVVNASGIFVDRVAHLSEGEIPRLARGSKGSHLVLRHFAGGPSCGIYVEARSDGRPIFIIPWRGAYLVGTTDIFDDSDPDRLAASKEEVDYLMSELAALIPGRSFTEEDVLFTFAGMRCLPDSPGKDESRVTRRHRLVDHAHGDGRAPVISVVGGKLTTYRSLAEECIDLVCRKLGRPLPCRTRNHALPGARGFKSEAKWIELNARELTLQEEIPFANALHLLRYYGSRVVNLIEFARHDPELLRPICAQSLDIKAQVLFAIEHEEAATLEDILLRRTSIGTSACLGLDCVETAARLAAPVRGWGEREIEVRCAAYRRRIHERYLGGLRRRRTPAGDPWRESTEA